MEKENKLAYWNSLYSSKDFFGTGPTKLAKLAESMFDKKNMNILEIGCGQGRDALFFLHWDIMSMRLTYPLML